MKYRVTNGWGSSIVTEQDALEQWHGWPLEQRAGNPRHGFILWAPHEDGKSGVVMSTSFLPIPGDVP